MLPANPQNSPAMPAPQMPADPMAAPPAAQQMPPTNALPPPPQPDLVLHDVKVVRKKHYGRVKVENVPPEEFGVAKSTRYLKDADYAFHEVITTQHKLISQGFDAEQVRNLPTYVPQISDSRESKARDNLDATTPAGDGVNQDARQLKVIEHYIRIDYDGKGKPRLYRVTTGGTEGDILKRNGEHDIVPVDRICFAAQTPIIMPHRLIGRSIADLVMDIQRIKTALMRGALDNVYLSNNPRPEVGESHAADSTLDDLMVWRPGAPIRTKTPGGIVWQQVPPIAANVFPVLEYMDATREWRTGVTKQGQGIDADALQNQSATAVNKVYSASQARIRLIARIFAETGIADLFQLIHETYRKNAKKQEVIRLRNEWIPVDPRQWKTRTDMTANVGLGTGDKTQQLLQLNMMADRQIAAAQNPAFGLVRPENLYNTAKQFTKLLGLKNPELYWTDPGQNPATGQQTPDPKMQEAQAKIQIAQAESQAKLQQDAQKAQIDTQMSAIKWQEETKQKREQMTAELQLKREQMAGELQLKREAMAAELELKQQAMFMKVQADANIRDPEVGGQPG